MNNFSFYSPTEFVFGKGQENNCGALVKKYGGSRVLIHYGGGSAVRSGLLDRVKASLDAAGVTYVTLGGVKPNPRDTLIYEGIELCRKENVDFILSVGGGSCIDSSKGIALGVPYDGDFWDFYGTGKPVEKALPIGTVLTIAAAGSEGSGAAALRPGHEQYVDCHLLRCGRGCALYPQCHALSAVKNMIPGSQDPGIFYAAKQKQPDQRVGLFRSSGENDQAKNRTGRKERVPHDIDQITASRSRSSRSPRRRCTGSWAA